MAYSVVTLVVDNGANSFLHHQRFLDDTVPGNCLNRIQTVRGDPDQAATLTEKMRDATRSLKAPAGRTPRYSVP